MGSEASPRRGRVRSARKQTLRWTKDRQCGFIEALASGLHVTRAAKVVHMSARSAYQLKARDPQFARAWAEALDIAYSELELGMLRRAIDGSERTEIVREGADGPIRQTKTVHSYSDGLAIRLLNAHRAEVQAYRQAEAERQDDAVIGARIRAHMDLVRQRLLGSDGPIVTMADEIDAQGDEAGDDG